MCPFGTTIGYVILSMPAPRRRSARRGRTLPCPAPSATRARWAAAPSRAAAAARAHARTSSHRPGPGSDDAPRSGRRPRPSSPARLEVEQRGLQLRIRHGRDQDLKADAPVVGVALAQDDVDDLPVVAPEDAI